MAVFRELSGRPRNFSWLIERRLAGSARPENEAQLRWIRGQGIGAIVCLNEERPLDAEEIRSLGFDYAFVPLRDFAAPRAEDIDEFLRFVGRMLEQDKPVLVCCEAGIGRTGTMLAAYLISQCFSVEEALERLKEKRGFVVESYAQKEALFEYARQMGKCRE